MKKAFLTTLIFISTPILAGTALQDLDITITQNQCLERSKKAMIEMGAKELEILELDNVLSASPGKYHYFVVCRADKGLAVVAEQGTQYTNRKSFVEHAVNALRN